MSLTAASLRMNLKSDQPSQDIDKALEKLVDKFKATRDLIRRKQMQYHPQDSGTLIIQTDQKVPST